MLVRFLVLALIATAVPRSASAQDAVPDLEICTTYPASYLQECGGRGPSMQARWFGPGETKSFASMATLLPELLHNMREAQDGNYQNFISAKGVTGEMIDLTIKSCTQVRMAVARENGVAIMAHRTGLCFGYTVNFYALNSVFAESAQGKFVTAINALSRDVLRR